MQHPQRKVNILDLPSELKLKIFEYAVKHPEPIKPLEWFSGSNKFGHTTVGCTTTYTLARPVICNNKVRKNGCLSEAVTAFDLSMTCKAVYNIVHGGYLFYKLNTFQFDSAGELQHYLATIQPDHRLSIRSIDCV